jgi:hypothetical protein
MFSRLGKFLWLMAAMVVIHFAALLAIPPVAVPVELNRRQRRVVTARRRGAENVGASLSKRRTWFTNTTQTDLASLYNNIYEDAVFTAREMNLMSALVTVYNSTGYADRTVPVYAQATARAVGDGVDFVTSEKLSKSTKATFTPSEVMAQFILTDRMVSTDPDNARNAAALELGGAIAEKIDKDLLGLLDNLAAGKGTAGSALTITNCAAALSLIRKNKARGQANFVLHPYQWHDIWVALGQPSANQAFLGDIANQALRDYYAGQFLGGQWFTTSNITVNGSDDAYGGVFTRDAIALDVRDGMSLRPERDESLRATELNAHTGYAVGTLWSDRGAYLLSDATEPV